MITTELCGALIYLTQAGQGADPLRHNLGYHVGDDAEKVTQERTALSRELGTPIVWMNQTHSTTVCTLVPRCEDGATGMILVDGEIPFDPTQIDVGQHIEADGLILDMRSSAARPAAIAVMTADCLPVLMSDISGSVVAAVHAGRVGLENGILLRALECYAQRGIPAHDICVTIAPAICGKCYEVPEEMAKRSARLLDEVEAQTSWGTPSLDLPHAAERQLRDAGVQCVNIIDICTFEDSDFHSYRRNSRAGRQASIIIARHR